MQYTININKIDQLNDNNFIDRNKRLLFHFKLLFILIRTITDKFVLLLLLYYEYAFRQLVFY